jgi:hypothetical protein
MKKKYGRAKVTPKADTDGPTRGEEIDFKTFLENMNVDHQLSEDNSTHWSAECKLCNTSKSGRRNSSLYLFQRWDTIMSRREYDAAIRRRILRMIRGKWDEEIATKEFLMVGPNGTGLFFHNHGSALNVCIHGRRRWWIFSGSSKEVAKGHNQDLWEDIQLQKDGGMRVWAEHFYPALPEQYRRVIQECVQEKGDIMYVPAAVEHAVMNYGDAIALSHQVNDPFAEAASYGVDLTPAKTLSGIHGLSHWHEYHEFQKLNEL